MPPGIGGSLRPQSLGPASGLSSTSVQWTTRPRSGSTVYRCAFTRGDIPRSPFKSTLCLDHRIRRRLSFVRRTIHQT